ncbi:MAG: hypothetical protein JWN85_3149 [Gammaproteobacteria bacterium]|nr:hypothetical protein [Gammaproteobacteria bacterium]
MTAPIDAITAIRMIYVGNVISPSDPGVVVITLLKLLAVLFTLPANALAAEPEADSGCRQMAGLCLKPSNGSRSDRLGLRGGCFIAHGPST